MIIFVDMDGVLANFGQGVIKVFQDKHYIFAEDQVAWHIEEWVVPEQREAARVDMNLALQTKEFWENLNPVAGAIDGFKYLMKNHEVYIATTPWSSDDCYTGKRAWVKRCLKRFDLDRLIFIKDKFLLRGDLIIDDKPKNVETFCGQGILYTQPWNLKPPTTLPRANNWDQVIKRVELII